MSSRKRVVATAALLSPTDVPAAVWMLIAAFSTPRTLCNMQQLCKHIAKAIRSGELGTNLLQKYWYMQWTLILWGEDQTKDPKEKLKRATLTFSMSRSDGKKIWRDKFHEEFLAWKKRTLFGVGCDHNLNNVGKHLIKRVKLNVKLASTEEQEEVEGAVVAQNGVSDDPIRTMALEAGIDLQLIDAAQSTGTQLRRSQYHQMGGHTKVKGKHKRGKDSTNVWEEWQANDEREANWDY